MNAKKLVSAIKSGGVFVAGAGILIALGLFMEGMESKRLRQDVVRFSASRGQSGTLTRESGMEGDTILAAYSLRAQGKASSYILHMECEGLTGKVRFLCAYAPNGAVRAIGQSAATDRYAVSRDRPAGDALNAMFSAGKGTTNDGGAENLEESILLAGLSESIAAGREAIEKGKGGAR